MAEYIDRDAIYTAFANACTDVLERASEIDYIAGFSYELVIKILDNIPTVNVAPVVRCEGCVFSQSDGWVCGGTALMPQHRTFPNSFCSFGERKDGGAGNGD